MKKSIISRALVALLVMLPFSACRTILEPELQGDSSKQFNQPTGTMVITATIEPAVSTKTALDGYQVVWKTGDQIKVFNDANPSGAVFTLDGACDGNASGTFTGTITGAGPFYAVYPASAATGNLDSGDLPLTIPQVQVLAAENFGNGANVAVAKVDDLASGLSFKNLFGAMEVNLSASVAVTGIRVQTKADEELWGPGMLSWSGDTPEFNFAAGTTDNQIIRVDGTATSNKFYVMLPAGAMASGFILQVISGGNVMFSMGKADPDNTIVRSGIVQMPAITFTGKVKASFLDLDTEAYGYFENIEASAGAVNSFAFDADHKFTVQYATTAAMSTRYMRVQSFLGTGMKYEFSAASAWALGATDNLGIDTLEGSTEGSTSEEYVLVQKTAKACWFVDTGSHNKGVIFKL